MFYEMKYIQYYACKVFYYITKVYITIIIINAQRCEC